MHVTRCKATRFGSCDKESVIGLTDAVSGQCIVLSLFLFFVVKIQQCKTNVQEVLLRILGGGVLPGSSPNPDPIPNQKMSFLTPVLRPAL